MRYLFLSLIVFSASATAHVHVHQLPSQPSSESVFNLRTKWTDQNGKTFQFDSLKGSLSIVAMAYTSCQSSCPLIVENMRKIESDVGEKGNLKVLIFSLDSKRDTPNKLKHFAENRKLKGWTLLHGTPKAVLELAAVLGVRFKEDQNGEFDHSNIISLLDASGVVKAQLNGVAQSKDEFEKKIAQEAQK